MVLRHPRLLIAAIVAAYLYVFPYFPGIHSANELPRVYLVKAIVDDHTFAIDRGVARWGSTADVSPYQGHQYSNKAPGSSLLVVPFYAVVRAVAGEPSLAQTMWLSRVVAGVIPTALFLWLLWGFLARFAPDENVRRVVLIAYALGSMAMTYSILFYSHQLAAVCIASSWILLIDVVERRRGLRAMLAVGALAGAAPLADYQAAFAGVPIAIYMLAKMWSWPRRDLAKAIAMAAAAAAVPIAILLAYHAICFGSPLRTGYDTSETFAHFHQHGFLGITELRPERFYGSLFAPDNGLFALAPWLLLSLRGGVYLLWQRDRAIAVTCIAVAIVCILFISSINFWRGGWEVGPRYITAIIPFLLPLVAAALTRFHANRVSFGAACGMIVAGIVVYSLSSATFPYWPDSLSVPFYEVTWRLLGDGAVAPNVGLALGVPGLASLIPYFVLVVGVTGWAIWRAGGASALVVAILVGAGIVALPMFVPRGNDNAERTYDKIVLPAVTR